MAAKAATAKKEEANPWPARLQAFKRFSQKFHERGSLIEARYQDDREAEQGSQPSIMGTGIKKVNLFYSNTTVIKESLYNSLPTPSVSRLHKGEYENEPARVAAIIMERGLTYEVHCAKYFDPSVKAAILDRLVPGLGISWITFIPPTESQQESLTVDIVYWKDFLYEPKRSWEQVTWCGRILNMTMEDARTKWGDKADSLGTATAKASSSMTTASETINEGKVCVIQMWDKTKKEVLHMTEGGEVLDRIKDPYQLTNFFPCPKPLIASPPTSKFLPLADYYIAQDQYNEADILYARINLIIEAVKVAGCYDSATPELGRMLSGAENKLIPVDSWAIFAEKGGVKGTIDWYPVEQVVGVLQQLVTTYGFIKDQLFEVTGMADIIRGSSNQYETAAAQQIKAKFASVRMNAYQRDVEEFVRDILRILGELMIQMYSDEKLSKVCGKLPEADQPHVAEALAILRNDFISSYSIDIETDSLTQADWGLQQQERMDFVGALTGFMQSVMPVMETAPEMAPMLLEVLKFATVGFKGSSELEGAIDAAITAMAAKAKEPPAPDPEQAKEQAKMQAEQQRDQAKMAMEQQKQQGELAIAKQTADQELAYLGQKQAMELKHQAEKNAAELQFLREKAQIEAGIAMQKGQQEIERQQVASAVELATGRDGEVGEQRG